FSPLLFLTLEPPLVTPVAPPPSRPAPSRGAVAKGEGTGATRARGTNFGGAGGVREEANPEEDTAVSTQRPRPASSPSFPSVPQFPPRSPSRPVGAEPRSVPVEDTGVPGGVFGGVSSFGGARAGGTSTATPTPCTVRFLTRVQHLDRLEREEWEWFERARQLQ
ncbi:unnamed protein product, partial [Closterium sp. NIES-53]